MRNKEATEWRVWLIFMCLLGMMAGAFFGRALLSVSMMAFVAATLLHKNILYQLKQFARSPLLVGISLLFCLPFISGLWSSNVLEWWAVVRTKLPLLVLPLAFAGSWQLSLVQWKTIFYISLLLLAGGCCWSLWIYIENSAAINESYLRAKSIPTPFENDHVRYSWLVALGAAGCVPAVPKLTINSYRILLAAFLLLFIVYLHLLVARTGLLCFYFFLFIYFLRLLFLSSNKKRAVVLAAAVLAMPLIAWWLLPTFQNRIRYIVYDFSFIKQQTYLPGSNDGIRTLSLKAGYNILNQNFFGVGAGDVRDAANAWYDVHVPNMLPADKLLPSSEWLIYGATAGWPGVLLFSVIMIVPFFLKPRRHLFSWRMLNSSAALSFLFDIGLEVQFGVFLYTFAVLCCYKWLGAEK